MTEQDDYPCGPKWLFKFVRRWLSPEWLRAACRAHDGTYTDQGDRRLGDAQYRRDAYLAAFGDPDGEGHIWRELYAIWCGLAVTFLGWAFKKPRIWFWKKVQQWLR